MASIEQLATALKNAHAAGDVAAAKRLAGAIRQMRGDVSQKGSWRDPVSQGLSFGFADEAAGAFAAGAEALRGAGVPLPQGALGDMSPGEAYTAYRDRARENVEGFRERNPKTAVGLEVAGAVPTAAIPLGSVARGAGIGTRMATGAKAGAAAGGVYGAGVAEGDLGDRAVGAATGATIGGLTGAAIPAVTAGVGAVTKPIVDAVRARTNPSGYAAQKVTERITNQGTTVNQAANRIDRAAQQGQSMTLMDVGGDSVRDLARTTTNVPGPARNKLTAIGNLGAMAQGDRLKASVARVFADPDSYQQVKQGVMQARAQAATPYYERAWATSVPYTRELEALLNTPAGKAALAKAKQNTLNRREPWSQWFVNVADDGSIIDARRVPDTRALHEVKIALDDVVEAAKRPPDGSPFGRPMQTSESRALDSVRKDLLAFLDENVPVYGQARAIALDNIQADEALELGRKSLSMDSRVLAREFGRMNDGQKEMARVGVAEALRKKIDDAGMTHDALRRFFSTREQVARLRPFFRNESDWRTFRSFIFNEARRRKSYDALRGNSTTARQLLDAQEAGQLGEMADVGAAAATGGFGAATLRALQRGLRRLGGLTPQTADEMARLLATRDPVRVREITRQLAQIEAYQVSNEQKRALTRQLLSNLVAGQEGRLLAAPQTGQ